MVLFGRLYIKWLPSAPLKPVKVTYDGRTRVVALGTVNQSFGPKSEGSSGFIYFPLGAFQSPVAEFLPDDCFGIHMDWLRSAHFERHAGKLTDPKNASKSSTEAQA